jgi:hypothetical protein
MGVNNFHRGFPQIWGQQLSHRVSTKNYQRMYIKYLFIIINLSKKYSSRDTIPLRRKKSDLKRGDGEQEMKEKTRSRLVELERQRKKDVCVYCIRGSRNKIRKAEMKRPEQRFDGVAYRKGTSNGSGAWLKILRIA